MLVDETERRGMRFVTFETRTRQDGHVAVIRRDTVIELPANA